MKRRYFFLCFWVLILGHLSLSAQVQMILPPNPVLEPAVENWLNVRLNYQGLSPQRSYFVLSLNQADGKTIWQGQSAVFSLLPGESQVQGGQLPIQQIAGSSRLESGNYLFCLELIQEQNRQSLAQQCVNRQLVQTMDDVSATEQKENVNLIVLIWKMGTGWGNVPRRNFRRLSIYRKRRYSSLFGISVLINRVWSKC
jgi:hypothetical protein